MFVTHDLDEAVYLGHRVVVPHSSMLVPVIVLMALGVFLTAVVRWFEQRVAPWKAAS